MADYFLGSWYWCWCWDVSLFSKEKLIILLTINRLLVRIDLWKSDRHVWDKPGRHVKWSKAEMQILARPTLLPSSFEINQEVFFSGEYHHPQSNGYIIIKSQNGRWYPRHARWRRWNRWRRWRRRSPFRFSSQRRVWLWSPNSTTIRFWEE